MKSVDEQNEFERQQLRAVREITNSLAKTIRDIRPELLERYRLGEVWTNVCIAAAFCLTTAFASAMATGAEIEEVSDERILDMIRELNQSFEDQADGS